MEGSVKYREKQHRWQEAGAAFYSEGEKALNMELKAVNRITRDIADGLILIENNGTIQYVNPSAVRLLDSPSLKAGIKYSEYMAGDRIDSNDTFHQYVIDCVYEKDISHAGEVRYTLPDGTVRYFRMNASWLKSDDGLETTGIILQFSDVTELHLAHVKHEDTIKVMVGLIAMIAVWNYVYVSWNKLGQPISPTALTVIIEAIGVAGAVFVLRYTSITRMDLGLGAKDLKNSVRANLILTLVILAIAIVVKLGIRSFFPNILSADRPFFDFRSFTASDLLYIPTVILQEFLTRGVVQGSLDRILPDHYPPAVSIIVSSLFFGAIHLHRGMMFMAGAALLLCFFGVIYHRQRTIWGLCIPHLFLSWGMRVLLGVQ